MCIKELFRLKWEKSEKGSVKENEEGSVKENEEGSVKENEEGHLNTDAVKIITDEPLTDAPDFSGYSETISNIITNSKPQFTVGIYGGWGTGKTTLMKMIQNHLDKYHKDDIITIWFDAWRYEYEKYLAVIPLIRTIKVTIENKIYYDLKNKKPIHAGLKKLGSSVNKVFDGLAKAVNLNASLGEPGKWGVGADLDVEKFTEILESGGSVPLDNNKVYYRKQHITDYLEEGVAEFRKKGRLNIDTRRVVVFVDDLDRCLPEKALELLESIKTFFDIEGIIFVIGMDPLTINPIIKTKYGKDPKIDGIKYLQKIVQLPFTIPLWNPPNLSDTLTNMIEQTHLPDIIRLEVLKSKELIVKAIEQNPRDAKRFINTIVVSHKILNNIHDIGKVIAVQAFYFRGGEWQKFLKVLTPYKQRVQFLIHLILWVETEGKNITDLDDVAKYLHDDSIQERKDFIYKLLSEKSLKGIYQELVNTHDNDLFTFLKTSRETLLRVDKIDKYVRVEDPLVTTKEVKVDIDSKKQLDLLRNERFDKFDELSETGVPIHLPYEESLAGSKLQNVKLTNAILFKANLSGANLSGANLSGANLSGANLYGANLATADLTGADLATANLNCANLSGANLYGANLSASRLVIGTDLLGASPGYGVDLSQADLTTAILSGANLSGANLSGANLSGADLSGADLSGADLSGSVIINDFQFSESIINTYTYFSNAITDNPDFLKYLNEKGCHHLPDEIRNKYELRQRLSKMNFATEIIDGLARGSRLPEN